MIITFLDFEKPIAELEGKIRELRQLAVGDEPVNVSEEVGRLESKLDGMLRDTYGKLSPWQKTQVARHPERPHFKDYIEAIVEDFTPLSGDRNFGEDQAIIGGLGRLKGQPVMIKVDDLIQALETEFTESSILPSDSNQEDWLQLLDLDSRKVARVRRPGDSDQSAAETMSRSII